MPKMWVLQACVYVFLLLGNSFVVSKTFFCSDILQPKVRHEKYRSCVWSLFEVSSPMSWIQYGNFPLEVSDFSIPDYSLVTTCSSQVSTSPLLFEFGVEKLYPISEGMIGGWLNIW